MTTDEAIVAMLVTFVQRERAMRDAIGKGGQQVNGPTPSITVSALHELEWVIRNAPEVAASYTTALEDLARVTAERDARAPVSRTGWAVMEKCSQYLSDLELALGLPDSIDDDDECQAWCLARISQLVEAEAGLTEIESRPDGLQPTLVEIRDAVEAYSKLEISLGKLAGMVGADVHNSAVSAGEGLTLADVKAAGRWMYARGWDDRQAAPCSFEVDAAWAAFLRTREKGTP
jgi:hypothetical protein